jgi:hypothetical protein
MPGDPGQLALYGRANGPERLNDRTVNQDGQIQPWRPVEHYWRVNDSRDQRSKAQSYRAVAALFVPQTLGGNSNG